ncbi:hypothetical protein X760_05905 [Mesorhizobium sp. LSHC422A00]|nr:hypothetical protein X760_05905 [Mesorhizobium sp. LSHC422A00]
MEAALAQSEAHILNAIERCNLLKVQMDDEGYVDLPPYRSMDMLGLGRAMARQRMVQEDAWMDVLEWRRHDGFYGVLKNIRGALVDLAARTRQLHAGMIKLAAMNPLGKIEETLENNREGNIKREFAELYSTWNWFCARFSASSLLSTEVWYAFNNNGSLLNDPAALAKIA